MEKNQNKEKPLMVAFFAFSAKRSSYLPNGAMTSLRMIQGDAVYDKETINLATPFLALGRYACDIYIMGFCARN